MPSHGLWQKGNDDTQKEKNSDSTPVFAMHEDIYTQVVTIRMNSDYDLCCTVRANSHYSHKEVFMNTAPGVWRHCHLQNRSMSAPTSTSKAAPATQVSTL